MGPCTVIVSTNVELGSITIRHLQRGIIARAGDLSRHMEFFLLLGAIHTAYGSTTIAWQAIRSAIEGLVQGVYDSEQSRLKR